MTLGLSVFTILLCISCAGCVVRWQEAGGVDRSLGTTYVEWTQRVDGTQRAERSFGFIIDFVDSHFSLGIRNAITTYPIDAGTLTANDPATRFFSPGVEFLNASDNSPS